MILLYSDASQAQQDEKKSSWACEGTDLFLFRS